MLFRHRSGSQFILAAIVCLLCRSIAQADLPNAPGKASLIRVCGKCHSPEQATSLHQDRRAWEDTMSKMVKFGAQGTDDEFDAILTYLTRNYGPVVPGPIHINQANMIDLETSLLLKRSEARAVIARRTELGSLKTIDDLRSVPGLDFKKIEAKRARLIF